MKSRVDPIRPQAPRVGQMVKALGRFHVTGVFWYRFHEWGIRILPNWAKPLGIAIFTSAFFLMLRNIKSAVASNLTAVLGECGFLERQRRVFRTLHAFAWCLTERYERLSRDDEFLLESENPDGWDDLVRSGQGFILVTGHIGNWEVGAARAADLERRRVHVVREREIDPRAQAFVEKLVRERMGEFVVTHFARDDVRLGLELKEALHQGDLVALQGDRPRAGGRTVRASLFGRPVDLPEGPFALSRMADVPLLPVFVLREGRFHYRTVFREPIRVGRTCAREEGIQAAADRMAQAIEWAIRQQPHQWFCFRELWR